MKERGEQCVGEVLSGSSFERKFVGESASS